MLKVKVVVINDGNMDHEPNHLARELSLGVTPNHMANVIECNGELARTRKNNLIRDQQNRDEA